MGKNNRVVGLVGIGVKNGSFNQGWDGYPRQKSDGEYVATDVSLKWAYRNFWNMQGKKVFYYGAFNTKKELQFCDINEKYELLFGISPNKEKSKIDFMNNLVSCVDVINFGAVYAGGNDKKSKNLSLTGVVQLGLGINKYEDAEVETFQILSPFRNSNEKSQDKSQKTSGTYTFVNEAHYMYSFTVNPAQMNEWKNIEYTEDAYNDFKEASLVAVSSLNTRTKTNCQNEFAMFVELKEDSLLYLPSLDQYVTFRKEDDKNIIDITKLCEILNSDNVKEQIDSIEIYYNSFNLTLEGDVDNAKKFNIITRGEI